MGHHGPKWVGDSKYSYFSSCRNFIGTSQHNSRHLIRKFSTWQRVVLLCIRYSVDGGPWWCRLRRATGCKDLDGLHGPQNIARTHCIDESLLTGPISRKSRLRRLRDTYKPEDERLNPWKFSEVFWNLVVLENMGIFPPKWKKSCSILHPLPSKMRNTLGLFLILEATCTTF